MLARCGKFMVLIFRVIRANFPPPPIKNKTLRTKHAKLWSSSPKIWATFRMFLISDIRASLLWFFLLQTVCKYFWLFISKRLYMFRAVPPPIIRSTQLYIQLHVLSTSTAAGWYCGLDGTVVPSHQLLYTSTVFGRARRRPLSWATFVYSLLWHRDCLITFSIPCLLLSHVLIAHLCRPAHIRVHYMPWPRPSRYVLCNHISVIWIR